MQIKQIKKGKIMNKKIMLSALTAATMSASWGTNAAIELRLNGQAYYDTETNLTWTTDIGQFRGMLKESTEFVSNFNIDGVGGWRIPIWNEMHDNVHNISDCSSAMFCYQDDQALIHFSLVKWDDFYWNTDAEGLHGGGWRPSTNGGYEPYDLDYVYRFLYGASGPLPELFHYDWDYVNSLLYGPSAQLSIEYPNYDSSFFYRFSVWPVHTGDVATISPVPEPETYAMLLAGLGLVGFASRQRFT